VCSDTCLPSGSEGCIRFEVAGALKEVGSPSNGYHFASVSVETGGKVDSWNSILDTVDFCPGLDLSKVAEEHCQHQKSSIG